MGAICLQSCQSSYKKDKAIKEGGNLLHSHPENLISTELTVIETISLFQGSGSYNCCKKKMLRALGAAKLTSVKGSLRASQSVQLLFIWVLGACYKEKHNRENTESSA